MHFGKLLRVTTSQMPEVEQILACYKACKKTIKSWPKDACVDVDDSAFVHTLSTHLCTFNRKWEERELACKVRFAALQEQIATACTAEDTALLHGQVLNLHGDVLLMLHWSMLAYTGLVKILKKYHKRTGKLLHAPDMTGLLSHPFCSTEGMSHLVTRVAALLQQLSEDLDLTVDAAARAAPACAAPAEPSAVGSAADRSAEQVQAGAACCTAHAADGAAATCDSVQAVPVATAGAAAEPPTAAQSDAWAEGSVRGGCIAHYLRQAAHDVAASEAAAAPAHSLASGSSAAGKCAAAGTQCPPAPSAAAQHCDSVASAPGDSAGAAKRPRDEMESAKAPCSPTCSRVAAPPAAKRACADGASNTCGTACARGGDHRDEIWERLCTWTARSNVSTNTRLIAQTQLALDTWQHIAHSKTPAPP